MFNDPTGLFADYSGYQWLPQTFLQSSQNSYLNNGYLDNLTGHYYTSDAKFYRDFYGLPDPEDPKENGAAYIRELQKAMQTNGPTSLGFNRKGVFGYWVPFIGKSNSLC